MDISIIGGADGPTAIFVTGDPVMTVITAAVIIIAVVLIIRRLQKRNK